MRERIELHRYALTLARIFQRPHSTIRFANNGSFELDSTHFVVRVINVTNSC